MLNKYEERIDTIISSSSTTQVSTYIAVEKGISDLNVPCVGLQPEQDYSDVARRNHRKASERPVESMFEEAA